MATPEMARMLPASTDPAVLAGADTSRRSSSCPTTYMVSVASTTPSGGAMVRNTGWNSPVSHATPNAHQDARPRWRRRRARAVGWVCTRRASGRSTTPNRHDSRTITGVRAKVTRNAAAMTAT